MADARIPIDDRTRVLVLTGAGISAESGLATFRGGGGMWAGHPVERVASPTGFSADPDLVWRFYSMRRRDAAAAQPNAAHRALVALEERLGASLEEEKTSENKRYKDLAKVYDAAPPDKVGSMLEKMDTKTAAGITMNMKRDKAGAVLGYLSPQKAIEITREITRVSGKTPSVP